MPKSVAKAVGNSPPHEPESNRYFSRAIGNALRVLELLEQSARPLALTEVSKKAALPKSSTFRILRTLEIAGYITRLESERFTPARRSTGSQYLVTQVFNAAQPVMRRLSLEFRETISLAFLFTNHIEVIAVADSPQRVSMGNETGCLIPPHASSLGKAIAAFQDDTRREKLLRSFGLLRFTPNTVVEEVALSKELSVVRQQGYARDLEESAVGGCCLGAPIFGKDGHAIAAISISMPKMRFSHPKRIAAAVRSAAAAITRDLRDA